MTKEDKDNESIGVVIGRFQPFHLGHAWLIRESLRRVKKIIILVGSSNRKNADNPWSLKDRIKMIEEFIYKEKISDKLIRVDEIIDVPDDDKWLKIALNKIRKEKFTVIGDNEWVNGIFESAKFKVIRLGYFERYKYEGAKIRELMKNGGKWENRVLDYLVPIIKK